MSAQRIGLRVPATHLAAALRVAEGVEWLIRGESLCALRLDPARTVILAGRLAREGVPCTLA